MGNSTTKIINTELGEVTVKKLTLADYAELLRAIDKLPDAIQKFTAGKTEQELKGITIPDFIKMAPGIIADSWEDFASILAVCTDKDKEFLLQIDAADSIDLIDTILELNDVVRIATAVKKIKARVAKMAPKPAAPSA